MFFHPLTLFLKKFLFCLSKGARTIFRLLQVELSKPMSLRVFLLMACAMLVAPPVAASDILSGPYDAEVIDVIDGDTLRANITIWPHTYARRSVRLRGIDAPERKDRDACAFARDLYERSRARLAQMADSRVRLRNVEEGRYAGRIIADVYTLQGEDIGATLLRERLVRVYRIPRERPPWC